MTVTYPNLSGVVSASQLNQNFADAIAASRGLTTANLASNAGILSTQIADRFSTFIISKTYLPKLGASSSVANLIDLSSGSSLWTMPNTAVSPGEEHDRIYLTLRAGKRGFITAVNLYAQAIGGTGFPQVWITKNGTVLGGGGRTIEAADTLYEIGDSSNPYNTPIVSIQDGDYLTVGLGESGSTPTMHLLTVNIFGKLELGA